MKTLFIMTNKKDWFYALIISLFIISAAVVCTVFFKPLYYFDIDLLNIDTYVGMSKDIIKHNYNILIDYQSIFYRGDLLLPDFIMSETGRIHFVEVKRIFEAIQILFMITGISSLLILLKNKKEIIYLKLSSFLTIAIPTVIGLLASIDFDAAFVIFHKIFFRNDYWIFDYRTDPIIMILPQDFFMHCFIMIVVLIMLGSLMTYIIYKRKEHKILQK